MANCRCGWRTLANTGKDTVSTAPASTVLHPHRRAPAASPPCIFRPPRRYRFYGMKDPEALRSLTAWLHAVEPQSFLLQSPQNRLWIRPHAAAKAGERLFPDALTVRSRTIVRERRHVFRTILPNSHGLEGMARNCGPGLDQEP